MIGLDVLNFQYSLIASYGTVFEGFKVPSPSRGY